MISMRDSISMLGTCHYLANRNPEQKDATKICTMSEPDDSLDLYFDFMEKLNPYDYVNDWRLDELLQKVFHRKKKEAESS